MTSQMQCILHPEEFSIELQPLDNLSTAVAHSPAMQLICHSNVPYSTGDTVGIHLPEVALGEEIPGTIDWCKTADKGFELSIKFSDKESLMRIRMLEQVCYIRRYRACVLSQQGRDLSEQDAALEWIKNYAHLFPSAY